MVIRFYNDERNTVSVIRGISQVAGLPEGAGLQVVCFLDQPKALHL
jgi:hypothetical protein